MELKKGYKQTEIGLIPEDWEVVRLPEVGVILSGLTYSPNNVVNWGTLVLRSSNIQDGALSFKNNVFVDMDLPKNVIVEENDILICVRNGSRNLIGKCALIDKKTSGSAFGAFMSIFRSDISKYVFFQFQSNIIQLQIVKSLGATINQITNKDLANFQIPLPPLPEQQAIAEVLSDTDQLIQSLKTLIAKKKAIKQGAMKELLTGKKRLPGFTEEWEVKKLGEILSFQVGYPFSSLYFNNSNGIRLIKNRDLKNDNKIVYYSGKVFLDEYLVDDGDVLVGMDGDFSLCYWNKGTALLNQRVGRIISDNSDMIYLFYYLQKPLKGIEEKTSSTTVKHLSHSDIEGLELPIPTIKEQQAIAEILSDMDAEIEALEEQLQKTQALKQGMMQELLTGRIRLVESVVEEEKMGMAAEERGEYNKT